MYMFVTCYKLEVYACGLYFLLLTVFSQKQQVLNVYGIMNLSIFFRSANNYVLNLVYGQWNFGC